MDNQHLVANAANGGGMAAGMAVAVLYTHGGSWDPSEVGILGAGAGAVVIFWASIIRRIVDRFTHPQAPAAQAAQTTKE
jgi:hypothetical protein